MAALQLNLVVIVILVSFESIHGQPAFGKVETELQSRPVDKEECSCPQGCYKPFPFQIRCCEDICHNAEERHTQQQCRAHCPNYEYIAALQIELEECRTEKANLRENFEETKAKQNLTIDELKKRLSETKAELEAAIESHREALDSKQFIASIVTPLCLFGALAFIALAFVAYSCAKGSRFFLYFKKKGLSDGCDSSEKDGSTLSSKCSSFNRLLCKPKFEDFNESSDGKDVESVQEAYSSCGPRPSCFKPAAANDNTVMTTATATPQRPPRSSPRSAITTTNPTNASSRPQHLEGESTTGNPLPIAQLAFPRQPELTPDGAHVRVPSQPLFQPLAPNFQDKVRNQPINPTAPEVTGTDAVTLCLHKYGGNDFPGANGQRIPRHGDKNVQNRWADPETREFDVKKDKMDSSAYRLASFNIADNTDVKVLD